MSPADAIVGGLWLDFLASGVSVVGCGTRLDQRPRPHRRAPPGDLGAPKGSTRSRRSPRWRCGCRPSGRRRPSLLRHRPTPSRSGPHRDGPDPRRGRVRRRSAAGTGTTFLSVPISPILATCSPRRPSRRLSSRSRPGPTTTSASAGGTPTGGSPRRSTPPSAITAPSASDAGCSALRIGRRLAVAEAELERCTGAPRRRGRPRALPAASLSGQSGVYLRTAVCAESVAPSPFSRGPVPQLQPALRDERALAHRGPDGEASWTIRRSCRASRTAGSTIIDLAPGDQPMTDGAGNWITYNGEIYNYLELRASSARGGFRTDSDTEVILARLPRVGRRCLEQPARHVRVRALGRGTSDAVLRARPLRDQAALLHRWSTASSTSRPRPRRCCRSCRRSRPTPRGFASTYVPVHPRRARRCSRASTSSCPGHFARRDGRARRDRAVLGGLLRARLDHTAGYFDERLRALVEDSVAHHLRSDVPVGAYLSGGVDSSIVAALASREHGDGFRRSTAGSPRRRATTRAPTRATLADPRGHAPRGRHRRRTTSSTRSATSSTTSTIRSPGPVRSRSTWSPSSPASRKVVLGGQGGDEMFGGYARYLLAYFEQCIKAAIEGTIATATSSSRTNRSSRTDRPPEVQAADPGVLARGLFGDSTSGTSGSINRAPTSTTRSTGRARRGVAVRALPPVFRGAERRQGRTSTG